MTVRPSRDSVGEPRTRSLDANEEEVARVMQICNACRYCEGFCAVFPAMTRRLDFGKADVNYLANLCHDCGACLHACQYALPHEFAVNVPRAMAAVRMATYADYAWPTALGSLYKRNGLTLALATAAGLVLFLTLALAMTGSLLHQPVAGNFYAIFPHNLLIVLFGAVFSYAMLALAIGVRRFWRDVSPGAASSEAAAEATRNELQLAYLDGGHGKGCNERDDRFTLWRRDFHHVTFYGFLLCFAATVVATVYHYALALPAPYPLTSVPVLLGMAGGIGLIVGPAGLLWLNVHRHPQHRHEPQKAEADGSRLHRVAAAGQRERPRATGVARYRCDGVSAGDAPRYRPRILSHPSLWQVCARRFPHRRTSQVLDRETAAGSLAD
jgi:citrate/tricarballylate utilization protein